MNIHTAYDTSAWKSIKVLITSRTEYLDNVNAADLFAAKSDVNSYEEVFIRPFDDSQIKAFISERLRRWDETGKDKSGLSKIDFEELILGNKDLKEIIEHPFMLEIVMQVLPKLIEKKKREKAVGGESKGLGKITRYEIYDLFINSWFKREGLRIRKKYKSLPSGFNPEHSAESYAIAVAVFMFEKGSQTIAGDSVDYSRVHKTLEEGAGFFGTEVKDLSREAGPFKRMGEMRYGFIHKSIQEFLIAKSMLEEVRELFAEEQKELHPSSVLNTAHIQKEPSILRFMLDEITPKELVVLERIILSTREDTQVGRRSPIAKASANSATLYVRTPYTQAIVSKDWSYTQLMGAYLDGAYFSHMNFTGSNWSDVSASSLQIYNSKCDDMNLSGFYAGEYASLKGHDSGIKSVHATSSRLVSGSKDNTIRIWDIDSGECLKVLEGHDSSVYSVYATDSNVISGSYDKTVRVWDIETGELLKVLHGHEYTVNSVFAVSSKVVSGSYDRTVRIWDIETGETLKVLNGHKHQISSVFVADSKVVSGSYDNTVRVWDMETGECLKVIHQNDVGFTKVYATKSNVISGGLNGNIRIWDIETGECLRVLHVSDSGVSDLDVASSKIISCSSDKTVRIFDIDSGECLKELRGYGEDITSVCVTKSKVISGCEDKMIKIWDMEVSSILGHALESGHKVDVKSIHIGEKYMFSAGDDKVVMVWDMSTGACLKVLHGHDDIIQSIYSNDSKILSGSWDESVRIWNMESGECLKVLKGHNGAISSVYAIDSKVISGSVDKTVRIWDMESGECLKVLKGHTNYIGAVCATTNKVISGGWDSSIRIWDIESGECLKVLEGHNGYVNTLYMTGSKLVSGGGNDKTIMVWDIESGKCLRALRGHNDVISSVYATDSEVISGSIDRTVRIWDIESRDCLKVLHGHNFYVMGVKMIGTKLISSDSNQCLIEWDLSDAKNAKPTRMIGRKSWEQPLKFIDNEAEHLCGLSQQNQRLFEQHNFKTNFKEIKALEIDSSIKKDDKDLILELKATISKMEKKLEEQQNDAKKQFEYLKDMFNNASNSETAEIMPDLSGSSPLKSSDLPRLKTNRVSKSKIRPPSTRSSRVLKEKSDSVSVRESSISAESLSSST